MVTGSLTFDDEANEDLHVFSVSALLTSHHDIADLDWEQVAERTVIDERRGLAITPAVVVEGVIDDLTPTTTISAPRST